MFSLNANGNSQKTIQHLNTLLSEYQVYYQNLRALHWNVRGKHFFELHAKFEELYLAAQNTIDEIAERILALNGRPLHTLTHYLEHRTIDVAENISSAEDAADIILNNLLILFNRSRDGLAEAAEQNDEGTVDLLSSIIHQLEKDAWMFRAFRESA